MEEVVRLIDLFATPVDRPALQAVIQDGFDRAVVQGPDLKCPLAGRLQPHGTKDFSHAYNTQAGSEALLWVGPPVKNALAKQRGIGTDSLGGLEQSCRRHAVVTAVAGRHVLGQGGVLTITRSAHVTRNTFAMKKDLDRPARSAQFNVAAGMAVGDRVKVPVEFDVIIDAGLTPLPFRQDEGLYGQGP